MSQAVDLSMLWNPNLGSPYKKPIGPVKINPFHRLSAGLKLFAMPINGVVFDAVSRTRLDHRSGVAFAGGIYGECCRATSYAADARILAPDFDVTGWTGVTCAVMAQCRSLSAEFPAYIMSNTSGELYGRWCLNNDGTVLRFRGGGSSSLSITVTPTLNTENIAIGRWDKSQLNLDVISLPSQTWFTATPVAQTTDFLSTNIVNSLNSYFRSAYRSIYYPSYLWAIWDHALSDDEVRFFGRSPYDLLMTGIDLGSVYSIPAATGATAVPVFYHQLQQQGIA